MRFDTGAKFLERALRDKPSAMDDGEMAAEAFDDLEDLEVALVKKEEVPRLLDSGSITHALVVSALETWLRRLRT